MAKKNLLALPGHDRQLIVRLWRDYMRRYLGTLFLAFFFMALVAATAAAYTWLLKYIVDAINTVDADTPGQAVGTTGNFIKIVVPTLVGLTILSGISMFIQSVLSNRVTLNVVGQLQKNMFASLQGADYEYLTAQPVGHFVSRFTNDVNVIAQALLRAMNNLVRDVLTLVFLIGAMVYHNWQLSLIILLVYPLAISPIITISRRIRGTAHEAQVHVGRITSLLNESLGGARLVRTYELEPYEKTRLGAAFDERIRLYLKLVTSQARVDPILEVLGGVTIAGVLAFGVFQIAGGTTTAGSLVAVLAALGIAAPRIRALGTLNNVAQEGLAALHRIFDVIDKNPEITEAKDALDVQDIKGAVAFRDVSYQYADGTKALHDLNFTLKPGTTLALVGPSGGGKSTVLNLLARLYDVSTGHIEIDGNDIRSLGFASLRRSMALVSQDIAVFDDTIAANIGFGKEGASPGDIERAAKAAAAHDFIMEQPNGYQSRVGEGGSKQSGGQRQRIALARAILRDAPILLLDEATSALDAQSEAKVQTALDSLTKGRTVIVIAHRLSTVKRADEILVLDQGRIVESGTHAELVKKKGLYAKLARLQLT